MTYFFYATQPSTSLLVPPLTISIIVASLSYVWCSKFSYRLYSWNFINFTPWIDSFSRHWTPPSLITWGLPKNHQVRNRWRKSASRFAWNYWPIWNRHTSPPRRPSPTARTPPRCWRNWRIRSPYGHRCGIHKRHIRPAARQQCRGNDNILFPVHQ